MRFLWFLCVGPITDYLIDFNYFEYLMVQVIPDSIFFSVKYNFTQKHIKSIHSLMDKTNI